MTELEMLRAANEGHVRMITDLAAERDGWKDNAVDTLRQLERVAKERDELKRERDSLVEECAEIRAERDQLLWQVPNY
jgi:uncharacterized coiled-coil DUF342 family protein